MKNRKIWSAQLSALILFLDCFFVGGSLAAAEIPADLGKSIGVVAEYKSNAEDQAQMLVIMFNDESINKTTYRQGQSLYAEAKSGFDGLIDQLIFDIQYGNTEALSPKFEGIQLAAKSTGDRFIEFVQKQLYPDQSRGLTAGRMRRLFETIREVGISIMRGSIKADDSARSKIINQLEQYKWSPFETIAQEP